ncbi:MAG: tryptophan synthase subunit alpha [Opitutae bacterium]|nr:tryptophan synthase subunit alpha [Opitutae bacterium]
MENTDRIAKLFSSCKENGRAAFVGYVCACDPDFETSLRVCRNLLESGVDLLELGVPFSDPLADGLTNQLAAQRALESGCTQDDVFRLVEEIRKFSDAPIVFYTYYNLVFSQGVQNYVERAKEVGVDGLLTLDLPPEEADELLEASKELAMRNIFIVAPTTPKSRIPVITKAASGFIYYVSREGVTGERDDLAGDLVERVDAIREHTDLPVVVGFGISNANQVKEVAKASDGVVVGSALVNCISRNLADTDLTVKQIGEKATELAEGLSVK